MNMFVETSPTDDAYWRSIVLFGKNSASYKFALGEALLEAADHGETFLSLEELAWPYARNIVEHVREADRQGIAGSSRFLEACKGFARDEVSKDELLATDGPAGLRERPGRLPRREPC